MTVSGYSKHVIPCELKSGCQTSTCLSISPVSDTARQAESCCTLLMSDLCVPVGRAQRKYLELAYNRCTHKVWSVPGSWVTLLHVPFCLLGAWMIHVRLQMLACLNTFSLSCQPREQTQIDHDLGCWCPHIYGTWSAALTCREPFHGYRGSRLEQATLFSILGLFWKVSTVLCHHLARTVLLWSYDCSDARCLAGCILLLTWY